MRTLGQRGTGLCEAEHPPAGNTLACKPGDKLPACPPQMTLFHPENEGRRNKVIYAKNRITGALLVSLKPPVLLQGVNRSLRMKKSAGTQVGLKKV